MENLRFKSDKNNISVKLSYIKKWLAVKGNHLKNF